MPERFEPRLDSTYRDSLLGWRRAAHCTRDSFAVFEPIKFKPKKREGSAALATGMKSTETYDLRLARLHLQLIVAKSFGKNIIEPSGIFPIL